MGRNSPQVAKVEDADEDDNVIDGSYHYARSTAHSVPGSPTRAAAEPNTGRKKASKRHSISVPPSDSDSTTEPTTVRRPKNTEKRLSHSKGKQVVLNEPERERRPSLPRGSKTMTHMPPPHRHPSEQPAYYGVAARAIPANSRPRASTRPQSYYGQTRPPLSSSAYYPPAGPPPFTPTGVSFPPQPQWMAPMGQPPMMASPMQPPAPGDYFRQSQDQRMAARFGGRLDRPQSAIGYRPGPERYENSDPGVIRRRSSKGLPRDSEDRQLVRENHRDRELMPPPPRPKSTRPESTRTERLSLRPVPSRKQVLFDDDESFDEDSEVFEPERRRRSVDYSAVAMAPRRRYSVVPEYEYGGAYALEPASSRRRSTSYYGLEDKIKNATAYQNDVNGGPTAPLTAESLRAVKNGGSSHSTRSSASRDESSYRQSATTRTTRSGSAADDDITIRVPNGAIVEVGNAKINCRDGGEINIGRNGTGTSQKGSDRGTVYGEDRKSRAESRHHLPTRTRASSQSRAYPHAFDPEHPFAPQPRYSSPYTAPYPAYAPYDYDNWL